MTAAMKTHTIFAKPNFAKFSDVECDASDAYLLACDPENEEGAIVTAFFDIYDFSASLTGLRIETTEGVTWEDRESAVKMLTPETVRHLEKINDQDDGYDPAADHGLTFADVM